MTTQSNTYNPLEGLDLDSTAALLEAVVGGQIAPMVRARAKQELAVLVVRSDCLNILQVVEAFELVPELATFASSIRRAALPT